MNERKEKNIQILFLFCTPIARRPSDAGREQHTMLMEVGNVLFGQRVQDVFFLLQLSFLALNSKQDSDRMKPGFIHAHLVFRTHKTQIC